MIAALYVDPNGIYSGLDGVECWGLPDRDAREYRGPWPVVAHPPCERWGRYWGGGPSARVRREKGDDGGCFGAALSDVKKWGGVLEHPEASHAWTQFNLHRPPRTGGWVRTQGGWSCCVEQGHYGHRARKATWLYYVGPEPPELVWGPAEAQTKLDQGFHSKAERARAVKTGACQRMSKRERAATPAAFRDLLLSLAAAAQGAAL